MIVVVGVVGVVGVVEVVWAVLSVASADSLSFSDVTAKMPVTAIIAATTNEKGIGTSFVGIF